MTQATYSIRLDKDKKTKFDEICERLGLSASAAFSTFVNKTIEKRGLPYELTLEDNPADYGIIEIDRISGADLLDEIQKGIDSAKYAKTHPAKEIFTELLGESK